jgi:hypothetical protein
MSRILWIAAPRPDDLCIIAETTRAARAAGWEPIVSPISMGGTGENSIALIDRLDPLSDAMLLLPHFISSHAALQERDRAYVRGIEIILPLVTPESIPPPDVLRVCPHYTSSMERIINRYVDICGHAGARCPPGKSCPIRRRCR